MTSHLAQQRLSVSPKRSGIHLACASLLDDARPASSMTVNEDFLPPECKEISGRLHNASCILADELHCRPLEDEVNLLRMAKD